MKKIFKRWWFWVIVVIILIFVLYNFFIKGLIELNNEKLCKNAGGKWGLWSNLRSRGYECNLPTSDAGKECTDSSQCENFCQAPEEAKEGSKVVGKCYGFQKSIGRQEVKNGIVGGIKIQ